MTKLKIVTIFLLVIALLMVSGIASATTGGHADLVVRPLSSSGSGYDASGHYFYNASLDTWYDMEAGGSLVEYDIVVAANTPEALAAQRARLSWAQARILVMYQMTLGKAQSDWWQYGANQTANPGLEPIVDEGNAYYTFINYLEVKYGIPELYPNILTGELNLPDGIQISQTDMYQWQYIAVRAGTAWNNAYKYQQLVDFYEGKRQSEFASGSPFVLPDDAMLSNTVNASWKDLSQIIGKS